MKKYLFVIIAVIVFHNRTTIQSYLFPIPSYGDLHGGKVILYSTAWCGYCEKTRQFLNEKKIPYHEYDIEKSREGREQYKSLGGRGVPVVLVNGSVIKGYSPRQILKYLNSQ